MAFKLPKKGTLNPNAVDAGLATLEKIAAKFEGYEGSRAQQEFQRVREEVGRVVKAVVVASVAAEAILAVAETPLLLVGAGELLELVTPIAIGIGAYKYIKSKRAAIKERVHQEMDVLWAAKDALPPQDRRALPEPYRQYQPPRIGGGRPGGTGE